jgi:hypothetical protein
MLTPKSVPAAPLAAVELGPDDHDHALLNQLIRANSDQVTRLPHRKGRSRPESAELRANAQVGAAARYDSVCPIPTV